MAFLKKFSNSSKPKLKKIKIIEKKIDKIICKISLNFLLIIKKQIKAIKRTNKKTPVSICIINAKGGNAPRQNFIKKGKLFSKNIFDKKIK